MSELSPENFTAPAPVPDPLPTPPPAPAKSHSFPWILGLIGIILGLGTLLVLCLCVILGISNVKNVNEESTLAAKVIDQFMEAMVDKDIDTAFALFSRRSQRREGREAVEKLIQGRNYIVFEGYKQLQINNANLTLATNTDPDIPQGQILKVEGTIAYKGNITGSFNAILEKEDGEWKLDSIHITVPPDKFDE